MTSPGYSLLEALPGVSIEVGAVTATLAEMWQVEEKSKGSFRASQLNLILHFGIATPAEEGRNRFDAAIRFAQRYPCRIIVLCPRSEGMAVPGKPVLEAKLFTQCYVGASMREKCCCEALMLAYDTAEFTHLRNQVTVWLEADLPVCHWFHRVPREKIVEQYLDFIQSFSRVIIDSAVDGHSYRTVSWPRPERIADLARCRLLPLKQGLGPLLAGYSPEVLLDGLEKVEVCADPAFSAEGEYFASWVEASLASCAKRAGCEHSIKPTFETRENGDRMISMAWTDQAGERLHWSVRREGEVELRSRFGPKQTRSSLVVSWLAAESELSEAIFF